MKLAKGIHPRAVQILKGKPILPSVEKVFRKVRPTRQVAMAKLMVDANNYSKVFAHALLLSSPVDQLVNGRTMKRKTGIPAGEIAEMEKEMEALEQSFNSIRNRYSRQMIELTVTGAYIRRLLKNKRISRFLESRYSSFYARLQAVAVRGVR